MTYTPTQLMRKQLLEDLVAYYMALEDLTEKIKLKVKYLQQLEDS